MADNVYLLTETNLILGAHSTFGLASKSAAEHLEVTQDKLMPWKKHSSVVNEWTSRDEHFSIIELKMDDTPYLDHNTED